MIKDFILFTGGPRAYAPLRLKREGRRMGIRVSTIRYRELDARINVDGIKMLADGRILPQAKGVFMRGLGEDSVYNPLKYYLIEWYEKNGAKVLNSDSFKKWPSLDKTTQHLELVKANLPIVDSFVFGSVDSALKWGSEDKFPFIVKENVGSCGFNVFKFKTRKRFERFMKGYSTKTVKSLLFQSFLKAGEDLRVIVLNGKAMGAMKRIAKKRHFLTNYSQGGSVEAYDLKSDNKAKDIALSVAKLFQLDYCGVDLMKDNNGNWIVLEVNRACQFEGFEKATKVNVAKKVLEFLTL